MSTKFQPPKGTRDFYPDTMAIRRYIEDTWRAVSIRHGFLEVDGPTFESLDLYKVKSGDEIVSQLFHFQDRGERELALRPEFTPTVARMIAEKANALPRPIKWFSIPRCFRAEQPQKGRLREFIQWNVDIVGDASANADVETMALCVAALQEFGLTEADVRVGWNNRKLMTEALSKSVTTEARVPELFFILDKIHKLSPAERAKIYTERACTDQEMAFLDGVAEAKDGKSDLTGGALIDASKPVIEQLTQMGLAGFFGKPDLSIVRGLAYYTGLVFEVLDTSGENRAIAGGGRYDNLIELFGGPALPAVGFGMGDVVLEILLREKGKLPKHLQPRPSVFVVNALETNAEVVKLLADLRASVWGDVDGTRAIIRPGLVALTSYKTTKNIGKLLQDAVASNARFALILAPAEMARGVLKIKDLATREEQEVALAEAATEIHRRLAT